jgi:hypothetical protein
MNVKGIEIDFSTFDEPSGRVEKIKVDTSKIDINFRKIERKSYKVPVSYGIIRWIGYWVAETNGYHYPLTNESFDCNKQPSVYLMDKNGYWLRIIRSENTAFPCPQQYTPFKPDQKVIGKVTISDSIAMFDVYANAIDYPAIAHPDVIVERFRYRNRIERIRRQANE